MCVSNYQCTAGWLLTHPTCHCESVTVWRPVSNFQSSPKSLHRQHSTFAIRKGQYHGPDVQTFLGGLLNGGWEQFFLLLERRTSETSPSEPSHHSQDHFSRNQLNKTQINLTMTLPERLATSTGDYSRQWWHHWKDHLLIDLTVP